MVKAKKNDWITCTSNWRKCWNNILVRIGWQILKCSTIGLIGMNHGWGEDDNPEKIITHGHENPDVP